MLSTRLVVVALALLTASPHPAWSRLAVVPSSRFLQAGTCTNNGATCDTTSEIDDCKGCSNDDSSCSGNIDCPSFKGCLRDGNYNGKPCPDGDECKGQATCGDVFPTCNDGTVGSCETGGGGGGNELCSNKDTATCIVDADCAFCAGGNNAGSLCSEANCNKGGGSCGDIGTCGGSGPTTPTTPPVTSPPVTPRPTSSPVTSSPVTSGGCGSDPTKTVEITNGSTQAKYNGQFYEFAGNSFDLLQPNAVVDIFQSGGYAHPFRLCAEGIVVNSRGKVGIDCVGALISDTDQDNTCNPDVTLPSSSIGLWYVCTVDGHEMFGQIY